MQPTISIEDEKTYCTVHPDRETGLRCNKCERYMCAQCAVHTPVGYRCRECVRQVDNKFFSGTATDTLVTVGICAALGVVAGGIALWANVLLLSLILGLPVGAGIAELALRATKRRRSRYSAEVATAALLAGLFVGAALFLVLEYQDVYAPLAEVAAEFNKSLEGLDARSAALIEAMRAEMGRGLYIPLNAADHIFRSLTDIDYILAFYLFTIMAAFAVYRRIKI